MEKLAKGIAALGRGPDTELVHMTKGEVAGLQRLAMAHGGSLTINPHTGLAEAGFLSSILPMLAGAAANIIAPGSGFLLPALAGGVTGLITNKDRPIMGALTGALGGYGGGNLATTFAGAGEAAANTATAEATRALGEKAASTAVPEAVGRMASLEPEFASTGLSPQEYANLAERTGGVSGLSSTPEEIARLKAQAYDAAAGAYVPPQQSYLDKLGKGITNPPTDFFSKKKNYIDMGAAAAPLAMGMFGGSSGSGAGLGGAGSNMPYSTSTSYRPAQASTRDVQGAPTSPYGPEYSYFPGSRTYGPGNSLANYGAAKGGLATLQGFADGGMAGTAPNPPDLNFYKAQMPYDPMQRSMDNYGGPIGYASGGIASPPGTYAAGGKLLRGPGDGVSDSIPAVITGPKPQRAALADGEFVVPARIVSELGNGSTEAGARKLYAMMDRVQRARKKSIGKGKVAVDSKSYSHLPA